MRHSAKGFTLLELVMTLVVMGVVLAGLPSALDSITTNAARSEMQTIAAFLAREKLEEYVVRNGVLRTVTDGVGGFNNIICISDKTNFTGVAGDIFTKYTYTVAVTDQTYDGAGFSGGSGGLKEVKVAVFAPGATQATAILTTVIGDYGE